MGIVVDKDLKDKIVGVKRLSDRIFAIKLVLKDDIIYIISAHAPQIGLDESVSEPILGGDGSFTMRNSN